MFIHKTLIFYIKNLSLYTQFDYNIRVFRFKYNILVKVFFTKVLKYNYTSVVRVGKVVQKTMNHPWFEEDFKYCTVTSTAGKIEGTKNLCLLNPSVLYVTND